MLWFSKLQNIPLFQKKSEIKTENGLSDQVKSLFFGSWDFSTRLPTWFLPSTKILWAFKSNKLHTYKWISLSSFLMNIDKHEKQMKLWNHSKLGGRICWKISWAKDFEKFFLFWTMEFQACKKKTMKQVIINYMQKHKLVCWELSCGC